ncbi:MAG: hypothetical protein EA397_19740 [Deltaproteobacteria bacterium]|nr:MAG: hypothetical protein EA397_19740 [Deltaproteobacteria bacterium]
MAKQCTTCGAAVEIPPEVMATTCRFCDSGLVDAEASEEPVERVVPFDLTSKRAGEAIARWIQSRWLAPEVLRRAGKAEALRPVFVPFYAYNAVARTRWSAQVGIYWQRTETYTTTENGKTVTKTRTVTETEWFSLNGVHGRVWSPHVVSASKGLPHDEAAGLLPYDLGQGRPFTPALIAGQIAEHPTLPHDEAERTAIQTLERLEAEAIRKSFLPGDTHRSLTCQTEAELRDVELALLPVWMAVVRYNNSVHRVLVNGQTGAVTGKLPTSWVKVAGLVGLVLAVLGAVACCAGGFNVLMELR